MGWSAQYFTTIIISGNTAQTGIFIYNGPPGPNTLIGSWANAAGTDKFGNRYPAGINVSQGFLSGVSISNPGITGASIVNSILQSCQAINPSVTGGTINETTLTFDRGGGLLLAYSNSTNVVTLTAGTGSWAYPGNTGTGKVECYGPGAGGGGGTAAIGGEAGGGGEYAQEPSYSLVAGTVYSTIIPSGGRGGTTNNAGSDGPGACIFDASLLTGNSVTANPGKAGSGGVGGLPGSGSTNTIHYSGGAGGSNPSNFAGGASGGNSGNPAGSGNAGINSAGSGGAASPTGQTGSGTGGAGGASGANGANGATPGAGGGGAGAGTGGGGSVTKTYNFTGTYSYYGSEVGQGLRDHNGLNYQGCYSGGINVDGDQYSFYQLPYSTIESDLAGATINSVKVTLTNQHSWYNSGCYVILGWAPFTSFGGTGNLTGASENQSSYFIQEGATLTQDVTGAGLGTAMQNGGAKCLLLGPSKSTSGGAQDLWNYGYFSGGANSGSVTVNYTPSGSSTEQGGNGGDARIVITYSTAVVLVAGVSPIAGTDFHGNAYGAGFSGQINAFEPGSSPTAVAGWHLVTLSNSWTNFTSRSLQYKYYPDNTVHIAGRIIAPSGLSGTSSVCGAVPTAYAPKNCPEQLPYTEIGTTYSQSVYIEIGTNGNITVYYPSGSAPASGTSFSINARIPLDRVAQ